MTKPELKICPRCGGLGEYDVPHPQWGSPSCPEAYVSQTCSYCDGKGKVVKPPTKRVGCPECDGEGKIEEKHPDYGLPYCPEAWVLVECSQCDGVGEVDVDIDDEPGRDELPNCVWRHAETPFAKDH